MGFVIDVLKLRNIAGLWQPHDSELGESRGPLVGYYIPYDSPLDKEIGPSLRQPS